MPDVDYVRPCKTKVTRDNFADHVARGSVLPGLDYATKVGDKVFATANGRVTLADPNPNQVRGTNVIIKHADGRESHYLHLSKLLVKKGDRVTAGEVIALSGNSGTTSTGPHLHFAIKGRNGKCVDPATILRREAKEARVEARNATENATEPTPSATTPEKPSTSS